jgi:hypothetical protein
MIQMKTMAILRKVFMTMAVCIVMAQCAFALTQHEKLWLATTLQKPLSADKKWYYLLYTQMRLINQSQPWQAGLVEGAVGYFFLPEKSVWFGYRWTAHRPNNGFHQANRLWQQLDCDIANIAANRFFTRSRLEEAVTGGESQPSFRLRQRMSWEQLDGYFNKLNPLIHEEIFLQLNRTGYTPHTVFSENRIFLGFRLITTRTSFWEIGYINQYQMSTPSNDQNQMNHVISINYNLT